MSLPAKLTIPDIKLDVGSNEDIPSIKSNHSARRASSSRKHRNNPSIRVNSDHRSDDRHDKVVKLSTLEISATSSTWSNFKRLSIFSKVIIFFCFVFFIGGFVASFAYGIYITVDTNRNKGRESQTPEKNFQPDDYDNLKSLGFHSNHIGPGLKVDNWKPGISTNKEIKVGEETGNTKENKEENLKSLGWFTVGTSANNKISVTGANNKNTTYNNAMKTNKSATGSSLSSRSTTSSLTG